LRWLQGGMFGGIPGGMPQNPEQMQQSMQQMMNNPVVQSLLDNPEFLRTMMQSNPAIRQVCLSQCTWRVPGEGATPCA